MTVEFVRSQCSLPKTRFAFKVLTDTPATIYSRFREIPDKYQPDSLVVTGIIHAHAARVHSIRIVAKLLAVLRIS